MKRVVAVLLLASPAWVASGVAGWWLGGGHPQSSLRQRRSRRKPSRPRHRRRSAPAGVQAETRVTKAGVPVAPPPRQSAPSIAMTGSRSSSRRSSRRRLHPGLRRRSRSHRWGARMSPHPSRRSRPRRPRPRPVEGRRSDRRQPRVPEGIRVQGRRIVGLDGRLDGQEGQAHARRPLHDPREAGASSFANLRQCADALHAAPDLGRGGASRRACHRTPASHGCIRLPRSFAKKLYNLTDFGSTTVVVTNKKARSSDEALGAA